MLELWALSCSSPSAKPACSDSNTSHNQHFLFAFNISLLLYLAPFSPLHKAHKNNTGVGTTQEAPQWFHSVHTHRDPLENQNKYSTKCCFLQVKHFSSHLLCFQTPLCSPPALLEPHSAEKNPPPAQKKMGIFFNLFFFLREGGRGEGRCLKQST